MLIVEPVVIRPLEAEWSEVKERIAAKLDQEKRQKTIRAANMRRREAEHLLAEFQERLRTFTVLDPACGSGNFLFLALKSLKDLEHRVQLEAEALDRGLQRSLPQVGPANVKGIEINPYAAELARVSVWIGEIQWMRSNGFSGTREPILDPLETIECRDALVTSEGWETKWPAADVVIGNPPFLGAKLFLETLGPDYTERLRAAYKGSLPAFSDLVCYWFRQAGELVASGAIARAGLVATNSIRGGSNRTVLDQIAEQAAIFDAWSDEPWVVDGAAVRVSLVCFAKPTAQLSVRLNGKTASSIAPDLTTGTADLTKARRLARAGTAFIGGQKSGPFVIPGRLAREWLGLPTNPNGHPNSDVLKPWINGLDLTRRRRDKWIVDFGDSMTESEAALYEAPFAHLQEHVLPMRRKSTVKGIADRWWQHWRPRPAMRNALRNLSRYIATPIVAKHRLFLWIDACVSPDHQLTVVARDDDTTFGILHSRFHEAWSLALCTWQGKGNDPRYTPTTTFATFPFPTGLSPAVPAAAYAENPHAMAIAEAARNLVALRDRWLNPPEWVEWVHEPVPGYPKRPVPCSDIAAEAIKSRTLTNLYNERPRWLADAHAALDAAVAAAYGWPADIAAERALKELLELNLAGEPR